MRASILGYLFIITLGTGILFQNCSPIQFNDTENDDFSSQPLEVDTPLAPVCVFNGVEYREGEVVTAFRNSAVAFGASCLSQERTCKNGSFSGSYSYATCAEGVAKSCLFNGATIPSGQSVVAYQKSTVSYGQNCTSEVRRCANGVLSGSYSFASCEPGQPSSCLFNGRTVAHGQTVTGYQQSSVAAGGTCVSQVRKCSNGVLSGAYGHESCEVANPAPTVCTAYGEICESYQRHLGRMPESSGASYWASELQALMNAGYTRLAAARLVDSRIFDAANGLNSLTITGRDENGKTWEQLNVWERIAAKYGLAVGSSICSNKSSTSCVTANAKAVEEYQAERNRFCQKPTITCR